MKRAIFPGTFDPFTKGHQDIVESGIKIFDEIIISIGVNAEKRTLFNLEERIEWINNIYLLNKNVSVSFYEGLTVNFAKKIGAQFILRGLRTTHDFIYEKQIAHVNEAINQSVQNVFVMSKQENSGVSSSIVRDLLKHQGPIEKFLPKEILAGIISLENK